MKKGKKDSFLVQLKESWEKPGLSVEARLELTANLATHLSTRDLNNFTTWWFRQKFCETMVAQTIDGWLNVMSNVCQGASRDHFHAALVQERQRLDALTTKPMEQAKRDHAILISGMLIATTMHL